MKKRRLSKKVDCIKKMPQLYNTLPNEDYSFEKSEVAKWIAEQKDLIDWIIQVAKDAGYIKYDKETGQWKGIEWEEQND